MTPAIQQWVRETVAPLVPAGSRVLEVGSLNVNGSVRPYFKHCSYLGIDRQEGKGVDRVCEVDAIDERFECILCLEALEHDPYFWETLRKMRRLLRKDGVLAISTPTIGFPYHGHPKDFYRFTEDAYRDVLFAGMKVLDIRKVEDTAGHSGLCGVAKKTFCPALQRIGL